MPVINGWTVLAHPLLLDQLDKLSAAVEALKVKRPKDYKTTANAKLLAAILQLITKTVPADPTSSVYRQGSTLGEDRKHWFRAKFGNGRFRLFFRYSSSAKVIIFAWGNDQDTLRTYGSKTDAYKVFKSMLEDGHPPDDWAELHKAASDSAAQQRLMKASPT